MTSVPWFLLMFSGLVKKKEKTMVLSLEKMPTCVLGEQLRAYNVKDFNTFFFPGVCVCLCVRERERESDSLKNAFVIIFSLSLFIHCYRN